MTSQEDLEFSLWYDASTHQDPITVLGDTISEAISQLCEISSLVHKSIHYSILKPGDERVPAVPKWLEVIPGAIPRLLLARVEVMPSTMQEKRSLVYDLDRKDLDRLRSITRQKHSKLRPGAARLTDQECDDLIDSLGMEVIMEQLRSMSVH